MAKRTMRESKIIYHLQNSESNQDEFVDFSTRVRHGEDLTLADFKTITRRFYYRYYFLSIDTEFGLIKTAIESNHESLPSFNGIIEAWLFEDERKQNNKIFTDKLNSLSLLSKKTPSWKRLLDLIEDFEATHQRKNQRYSALELSTSSLNDPERAMKQNGTQGYLETSFFTAEPVEIARGNYSTTSTGRKLYPISSSPIRNSSNHGNIEFSPEQSSAFPKVNLFGTESGENDQKSTLNDSEQKRNEVLLQLVGAQDEGIGRMGKRQGHKAAVLRSVDDSHGIFIGICKQSSTDDMKRIQETCQLDLHDSPSGSYVDLAPPSGQNTSKEETKSDLIKCDVKYFHPSNQNISGDEPNGGEPHNNTKESSGSAENRFLENQRERPKDTHRKPKIRRPLQYVYEPEVLHNGVAELNAGRHGVMSRFRTGSTETSPVKPPRTFEYTQPDTERNEKNPFREIGTHSIPIGNLTTKSSVSVGIDGLAKPRRRDHNGSYQHDPYRITCSHAATRACSTMMKEHQFIDRKGVTLPDVCLSLFDISKMSREKSQGIHPERPSNTPKATPKRTNTLDKYGYQTCLRHRSVTSIKNLSTPGHIPSSCLSLCNYNMNLSSSSVCGSSRHFVNTESKGNDAEVLISVEPNAEISEQIENLTSDCEVCKLNDKYADDVISESVLSLYDFKMADIEIGSKTRPTSARNLHKDSMACCRSQ
ncbi:hypothetical protein LOTGIDRAFT_234231 [Lottia gigantea]|uniref:DIX domain-containing protein n=1 Tax=Lottia gigantea TaxID=225164 RepID=V3ZEP8_LOTGI|nr:hypothetical protein LOTGIDRAFT_234231 [Lottia gigantea]ESO89623.1 hypothetical protein LOTGIDRAFT_234231 [Lottia gigantea]